MIRNIKFVIIGTLFLCINAITIAQKMNTPVLIKAAGKVIDCTPPYAGPTFFDLDNDGLLDLIIGTLRGEFRFYKNIGTINTPVYDEFTLIQVNGEAAKIKNW